MLNLKKTAVAVLALSSSVAFAGTMGAAACTSSNVTVPCESNALAVGVQALYLQPSYSNGLAFADIGRTGLISDSSSSISNSKNKWNWGFKLETAYQFNTGNDLNLNYYHLTSKSRTTNVVGSTLFSPSTPRTQSQNRPTGSD